MSAISTEKSSRLKRVVIAVVGGTVFALGIALLVLPGPAILVLPAGLAILAIEFAWARRWLRSLRAVLPRDSQNASPPGKPRMKSAWRRATFLFRRFRRALLPKKKAV